METVEVVGNLQRGTNVHFGNNVHITAKNIRLGDNVRIADNVTIKCLGDFELGNFGILAEGVTISCNNFKAGQWLYTCKGVDIGRGGCFNPDSNVTIGDYVGLFEGVVINPNSNVYIGDHAGIGADVMIWTHGAWLNPLEGFPKDFGPVHIGKNVWLPARTIVLPNVTIGDNVVVGTNSLVNKSLPSGCLAAGSPVKVLKENVYPKMLDTDQKISILNNIIQDWRNLIQFKGVTGVAVELQELTIVLTYDGKTTYYDTENKTTAGDTNTVSEDFRDFLRRNGIKIYTDNFFKSI